MKSSATLKSLVLILTTFLLSEAGFSQQLVYTNPQGLTVCDSAYFQVEITNDSSLTLENAQLQIALPDCLELLQSYTLSIPALQPGQSDTLQIGVYAPCACYSAINTGELFINQFSLFAWGDTLSFTSTSYEVETAELVITQVTNSLLSGSKGDVLSRSFTVLNTRPGVLTNFLFQDFYQNGIELSSPNGTVEANDPGFFAIRLTGADFQAAGDGDTLFEQGESITITEEILITSCGYNNPSSLSTVAASWGCGGQTCQLVQQTALVQFQPTDLKAELSITPFIQAPSCFCAGEGVGQGLTIVNTGSEPAYDLLLSIQQLKKEAGIDPSSVTGLINGMPIVPDISFTDPLTFTSPCLTPGPFQEQMDIQSPDLLPGDTLLLQWDTWFCTPSCSQAGNWWSYEYRFQKSCPPNQTIQSDTIQVQAQHPQFQGLLAGDLELLDGEVQSYSYELTYDSLTLLNGQLEVQISLPCGLTWENNDLPLSGVLPDALTVTTIDSQQVITAWYPLPLPANTVQMSFDLSFACADLCQQEFACADSLLTSCPQPSCAEEAGPGLFLDIQSSLLTCEGLPAGCGPQTCESVKIFFLCEPDSICLDTVRGYVFFEMDLGRTSIGLPDNDNDRWPDGPFFQDSSLLRLDRSMPGDTIQTVLRGVIIVDEPGSSFPHAAASLSFQPVGADPDINSALYDPEGIQALDASLKIRDAGSGTYYECSNLSFWAEPTSDRLIWHYDIDPGELSTAGCPLPGGFTWENGDSIWLIARHRLNTNPVKQSSAAPSPPIFQVTVRPVLAIGQSPEETTDTPFQCGCNSVNWEITGYETLLLPGVFAIPFCDTSSFQGSTFFKLEIGAGNFFPYEYRPLGGAPLLQLALPAGIELTDARLKQFTLQQGPSWVSETTVVGVFGNGVWSFDLSPFQDTLADEGFYFLFQYRFTAECATAGTYPMDLAVLTDFAPQLLTPSDTLWVEESENALKLLLPTLQLFNPLPNQLSLDNKARWNFTLTNLVNSVSGQQSGPAPHVWLAPLSPSGALSDFLLTDTQTGLPIPAVNGIFQLDTLQAGAIRHLELVALNESCEEETLELRYGFGCTPLLDLADETCQTEVQYWQAKAPPGGVDMYLLAPSDTCALLCDTVPYHTITLYNTNLGPVCDPFVVATLPPGLHLTPGSSQVAYPANAAFSPVSDPIFLGNNTYRWNLSELSADLAANCLPGLGAAPMHQVSLRFWTETDCGFAVNSSILFQTGGQRNCGIPVNLSTRPADPICIAVEGGDIETFFQAGLEDPIICQDTGLFNLALVHGAVSALTDSLRLLLPPGVAYVAGSMTPVANMSATDPWVDTLNGRQRLHWAFPPGLNPFTLIAFQLSLSGFSGLPCGEDYFLLSAGIQSEAICAASGDTCSIRVETGSEFLPLEIQRPVLDLLDFRAEWNGDSLFAEIQISNQNGIPAEHVQVDIWWDTDGDGLGDSLLLSPILPGITSLDTLFFSIPASEDLLCGLIAVIDSTQQCLCGNDSLALQQPVLFREVLFAEGCSDIPLEIGFCLTDWTAQWPAYPELLCDTCCTTSLLTPNESDSILLITFHQFLIYGQGCTLVVPHEISIRPRPGIAYADPVTCAGEPVNLIADPGLEFTWAGPGVATPQQQGITVSPLENSTFTLNMTDLSGCPGTDSITITVHPLPIADAGADTVFCPGDVFQLEAYSEDGYSYLWSPQAAFQNPLVAAPLFTDPGGGLYLLEVTAANGCTASDSILVSFGSAPVLQLPPDTLVCAGDTLILQVTGDFATLEWEPVGTATCLNPPVCDSILVAPLTSLQLTAIATNTEACQSSAIWSVAVADDGTLQLDTAFTCADEPVWLGGLWTTEPGLYCDTLVLPSGCQQVFCSELFTGDTLFQEMNAIICPGDSLAFGGNWYDEPGVYTLALSTWEGCDSTLRLDLSWHELPLLTLLPADTTILEGESVVLTVLGDGLSYSWAPSEALDCDTCEQVFAKPAETTVFRVAITDANGCIQYLESRIAVRIDCEPGRIQLPNAFTPDGDGLNDSFGILTKAEKEFVVEMQIWNRWGQLVFESRAPRARWDGLIKGEPAPSDEYAYRIVVGCADGAREVFTGSLSLIR